MQPSSATAFLDRLRAELARRPAGVATVFAVVLVAVPGRAEWAVGRAGGRLRSDDVLAVLTPRVVVAAAPVRRGSGPETFRDRVARSLLSGSAPDELRRRSIVVLLEGARMEGAEERIGLALDELLARPRRRPEPRRGWRLSAPPLGVAAPELSLRERTVRGGGYLVAREAVGMVVRLAGVVLTVRVIGPASYGIYSAALAFVLVVTVVAQMGIETYLIRQPAGLERRHYDVAFTFLVVTSLVLTAGAIGLSTVAGGVLRPTGVVGPLRVLLLSVPINVLWAPAQAAIERQFRYRAMGLLELGGDVALYATAIPLALDHKGAWSLVAGFLAMQTWQLVGSYVVSGLRPRLAWSGSMVRELVRHGFSYSLSVWADQLRGIVSPLVVGSFAGAAGVGYVAFAQRLVVTLAFARRGAYRLGMVAMARVPSGHRARLRAAIEEGTVLQLIALGVPFALFGLLARRLVPLLFGATWSRAIPLYVAVSVAAMLSAVQLVQSTFLFSRGRNLPVASSAAASTAVLAVVSYVAVHHLGLIGYGYGSLAALSTTWILDRATRREVHFSYVRIGAAAAVTVPVALAPVVPGALQPALFAPLCVGLLVPPFRREVLRLVELVRTALGRGKAAGRPASEAAGAPRALRAG